MINTYRLSICCCLIAVGVGCNKSEGPASAAPAGAAAVTAGKAPGAIKADKTAGQDGPLLGDSADDGVIALSIDGPISALAVVLVDASGALRDTQWDTVVEQQPMPAGWASQFKQGADSWQLGVEESGNPLNAPNGSLKPIAPGHHRFTLFVGDASSFKPVDQVMVLAERPDHSVVKSNVFTM